MLEWVTNMAEGTKVFVSVKEETINCLPHSGGIREQCAEVNSASTVRPFWLAECVKLAGRVGKQRPANKPVCNLLSIPCGPPKAQPSHFFKAINS